MVTTCTYVECLRTQDSSQYMHVLKAWIYSLVCPDPFLAQGVYRLQYKHPAKALSSMAIMLCSYPYVLKYQEGK